MTHSLRYVAICGACALALAGCAGTLQPQRSAEQPVSQQVTTSDASQRAKVHTELGSLYLNRGNFGIAQEEARAALSADENYAPAHNLMGLVHMQLSENGLAEASFERGLRLAPDDAEINNSFGWFLCQTGREQRSLQYFDAAIRSPLYTTPSMPSTNAGICALRLKDDKRAEDYFSRALRADSGNDRARYFLADILYRQGRFEVARQHLVELHKLVEPTPETLWLALRVERKLGDRETEARLSSQLRRKYPGSPEVQRLMQGNYE